MARLALLYAGAVGAGYVMARLNVPLPWMIGPMLLAATVAMCGITVKIPLVTRPIGQTVVAGTVGLSFTPAALEAVGGQIVPMVAAAVLTILFGFITAAILMRLTRVDVISASLASIPGGPVEMAMLAEKHGVAPGPVAFAQTLRIALLVLIIPPALAAIEGGVRDISLVFARENVTLSGTLLLLGLAGGGGFLFRALRISSPFFLGPLGLSAAASAMVLPLSMPPYWLLASAQVLLGVWLGSAFDRELLGRARGFVPAALVSTLVLLVLCVAMAFGLGALTGVEWQTMVLASAPGSVTEMALTAKMLQQGVALVTAYHVVRIFIIIPAAPLIFALTARVAARLGEAKDRNSDEN